MIVSWNSSHKISNMRDRCRRQRWPDAYRSFRNLATTRDRGGINMVISCIRNLAVDLDTRQQKTHIYHPESPNPLQSRVRHWLWKPTNDRVHLITHFQRFSKLNISLSNNIHREHYTHFYVFFHRDRKNGSDVDATLWYLNRSLYWGTVISVRENAAPR